MILISSINLLIIYSKTSCVVLPPYPPEAESLGAIYKRVLNNNEHWVVLKLIYELGCNPYAKGVYAPNVSIC